MKVIKNFKMFDVKPNNWPLISGHNQNSEKSDFDNILTNILYVEGVGTFMYAMFYTRPNSVNLISILKKFVMKPKLDH